MSIPLPRASLVLLSYNQEQLLPAAAQACLAQDCEPLEIVFSDDASSDGSFDVLQRIAAAYRARTMSACGATRTTWASAATTTSCSR